MNRSIVLLLIVSTLPFAGCATQSELADHPANESIQREVYEILEQVRTATGPALMANLKRLAAYDVFAIEPVAKLLDDPNPRVRSNAVWVLGRINDPNFPNLGKMQTKALEKAMDDSDRLVRYEAAAALLERSQWEVIPVLIHGLDDEEPSVATNCAEVLRRNTSKNFGFSTYQSDEERRHTTRSWEIWYRNWERSGRS